MAVNLATKYSPKTSDLIKMRSKSDGFHNNDYEWDGVNAIIVTTLTDPVIGNYNANGGANRYGNPTEVEDTNQTWTLTRDRAWTKTIDKKNQQDLLTIKKPGKYLAQATKNVLVPEIDTFNFQTLATAGTSGGFTRDAIVTKSATSASNAFTNFTTINADITDHELPTEGRQAGMTATYYNFLKQGGFVLDSDSAYRDRKTGNLGQVDGVTVVIVPSNRMPSTSSAVDLMISHPMAMVAPEKLVDYTLHNNPPGISGALLEYRHRYDAFVDTNRVNAIGMHVAS